MILSVREKYSSSVSLKVYDIERNETNMLYLYTKELKDLFEKRIIEREAYVLTLI